MAVYLITGVSSGIGRELARQAVGRGHEVFGLARRAELLESLKTELGEHFTPYVCDVTDKERVRTVCGELPKLPNIVILNAGVGDFDSRHRVDAAIHERSFAVNYFGALYVIEALFPGFAKRGSGRFVAVSSLAGYRGLARAAAYDASKAALTTAMESMRLTYARKGIGFTVVMPGFVDTAMTQGQKNMAFLYTAEKAARTMLNGIERKKHNIIFPWPMRLLIAMVRLFPASLHYRLFRLKS